MAQNNQNFSVETLIAASLQHGEDSEPDHEVGDLQEYLRAAWSVMSLNQRMVAISQPLIANAIEEVKKSKEKDMLFSDSGLEVVLNSFAALGRIEMDAVEVTDLQEALRTFWNVLPKDRQMAMLELDSTQETFENATAKPLFRYVASSGWGHIFEGRKEDTTRWIYDQHENSLTAAQVLAIDGSCWVDIKKDNVADLLQDIEDNDAVSDPDQWDLYEFISMPTWQDVEAAGDYEQISEPGYHQICEDQGWNSDARLTILESFINDRDLLKDLTAYVAKVATEENQMSDDDAESPAQDREDAPRG